MKQLQFLLVNSLLLLAFTSQVHSQNSKLKRADKLFQNLAYLEAIELYDAYEKTNGGNFDLWKKQGYSYYFVGNTTKAEEVLRKCVDSTKASEEDYFYFAQALKQNGKYEESNLWMNKMYARKGSDFRAISFSKNANYFEEIQNKGAVFTIRKLKINSSYSDFGGYPDSKEEKIYFVSGNPVLKPVQSSWAWNLTPFLDLYTGSKTDSLEIIKPNRLKRDVNSNYHEGPLCFTSDGKQVYFTRNNLQRGKERRDTLGNQNLMLFLADIAADGSWTNIRELPFNSKMYSVGHPTLSLDNKTLYFVSDKPGGFGKTDLYSVAILGENAFGEIINLGSQINTEGSEMFPWIDKTGNFFFSSDGIIGLGGLDVFVIPSESKQIINVGMPVNSSKDDFSFIMLSDGKSGYFSSNRNDGETVGNDEIYSFNLLKPFISPLEIEIKLTAGINQQLVPGTIVVFKDTSGTILFSDTVDNSGLVRPQLASDYRGDVNISTANDELYPETITLSIPSDARKIEREIFLTKKEKFALFATVVDMNSKSPLDSVQVVITNRKTNEVLFAGTTDALGSCFKPMPGTQLGDQLSLQVNCQKEGYLPVSGTIDVVFDREVVVLSEKMNLNLVKLEKGMDLASLIDIKPIYFDLNKYNIRKDAAVELEKIIKVMNDYPTMVIELGSHTDCRSSYAYNEKLSDNRAKASAAYIQARITNPQRIYGKGYGEYKLKNDCACEGPVKSTCTEAEHQENRRTEFIILNF